MTAQPLQSPKHYAKLICHYMKTLPDKYADDPQDVQDALGLSEAEFKSGLNWCVGRKLITLDKPLTSAAAATAAPKPASPSPFMMGDEDEDDTVGAREDVFGAEAAV